MKAMGTVLAPPQLGYGVSPGAPMWDMSSPVQRRKIMDTNRLQKLMKKLSEKEEQEESLHTTD